MSCEKCDEIDKKGDVAYYRIGNTNVGLIGCDKHLSMLIELIRLGEQSLEYSGYSLNDPFYQTREFCRVVHQYEKVSK